MEELHSLGEELTDTLARGLARKDEKVLIGPCFRVMTGEVFWGGYWFMRDAVGFGDALQRMRAELSEDIDALFRGPTPATWVKEEKRARRRRGSGPR